MFYGDLRLFKKVFIFSLKICWVYFKQFVKKQLLVEIFKIKVESGDKPVCRMCIRLKVDK